MAAMLSFAPLRIVEREGAEHDDLRLSAPGPGKLLAELPNRLSERVRVPGHRHPAVPVANRSAQRVGRRAADVDRRLGRSRPEEEGLPVLLDHIGAEGALEQVEGLVRDSPSLSRIDTERAELGLHPAHSDPEAQPIP